jgi:cytoskeletal protein CcmA (bactofilin family)
MFRRKSGRDPLDDPPTPMDRVTSVIGTGTSFNGRLTGSGGVRIEGAFEGEIALRGLLVIGESGMVTCEKLQASNVVIGGVVRGNIYAEKVDIRSTGRVWGDIVTAAFATEEGAFLKGQIQMEEEVDPAIHTPEEPLQEAEPEESVQSQTENSD